MRTGERKGGVVSGVWYISWFSRLHITNNVNTLTEHEVEYGVCRIALWLYLGTH